jgi:hypothetical protein
MPYKNKEAMREAQARHYQKNKTTYQECTKKRKDRNGKFLIEYKQNLSCLDCGMADWRCLDFHHEDDTTKRDTVSNLAQKGYAIETIMAEIAKCVVLCANCHRIRHAGNIWEQNSHSGAVA